MAIKKAKESKAKPKRHRVRFSIFAKDARHVVLAGDFNQWDQTCKCIKKKNGHWEKTVLLPPGTYEYKFLVDGRWCLDPTNDHVCANSFGTRNNVRVVNPK